MAIGRGRVTALLLVSSSVCWAVTVMVTVVNGESADVRLAMVAEGSGGES